MKTTRRERHPLFYYVRRTLSRRPFVIDRTVTVHRAVVHVRVLQIAAIRVAARSRRRVRLKKRKKSIKTIGGKIFRRQHTQHTHTHVGRVSGTRTTQGRKNRGVKLLLLCIIHRSQIGLLAVSLRVREPGLHVPDEMQHNNTAMIGRHDVSGGVCV